MGLKRETTIVDKKTILGIKRVDYNMVGGPNSFRDMVQQIAKQDYYQHYSSVSSYIDPLIEDDVNHGVPHMNEVFYGFYGANKVIPSGLYIFTYILISL